MAQIENLKKYQQDTDLKKDWHKTDMEQNKKNRKGSTYVDSRTDKVVSRRPHPWTPPKGSGTTSKNHHTSKQISQVKDLAVEKRFDSKPIQAAAGYEVHQIEREGAIIGYASRPQDDKNWTMTLPDGTELQRPAKSLDEAGEALVVADDQIVYNKYPDYMNSIDQDYEPDYEDDEDESN